MLPYRARCQLLLSQQRCLVLADMFQAQLIRRPMEVPGELLNHVDVTANRPRRVVTALQFLKHDLAQMGHRDTSFSATQLSSNHLYAVGSATRSRVRRCGGFVQAGFAARWTGFVNTSPD